MRDIRLYTDQPLATDQQLELAPEPAHHLVKVLRARVGDTVVLFDGSGWDYACTVTGIHRNRATLTIGKASPGIGGSPLNCHLGLCLSKGDRFDWAIQKATELGVTAITPLLSERVDVKIPAQRVANRLRHWRQVVAGACEQSGRSRPPETHLPLTLSEWVCEQRADLKAMLHHRVPGTLPDARPDSVALLVGPEGGLSPRDLDYAQAAGFTTLNLGPRVLRTETAPLVALSILGAKWGDLL